MFTSCTLVLQPAKSERETGPASDTEKVKDVEADGQQATSVDDEHKDEAADETTNTDKPRSKKDSSQRQKPFKVCRGLCWVTCTISKKCI